MLVLKTKYQKLSQVAFAPDGRGLAAAGQHGAYWWASVFNDPKPVRFGETECGGVGFTPEGTHLITCLKRSQHASSDLCAVELANRVQRSVWIDGLWLLVRVCPATGRIVVEQWSGGEMSSWQIGNDGAPTLLWRVTAEPGSIGSSIAFASDGSWVARVARYDEDQHGYRFVLRDAATGETLSLAKENWITWVSCGPAVSPDKKWIAYATQYVLHAFSLEGPKQYKSNANDTTHQFTGLAFHPSGRYLAATNNDETVKLYDTTSWEVARTFTWDIGKMRSIAFNPDGTLAAAGSDRGKVVVWDVDL